MSREAPRRRASRWDTQAVAHEPPPALAAGMAWEVVVMRRTPMPRRRTPLRAIKPLRRAAARGKRDHYAHLRALVHAREGGCCARCGVHAPLTVGTVHHRRKQGQGGKDTPENCVWTCYPCNGGWIEDNPAEAIALGWTVPNGAVPEAWPVWRQHFGAWGWWQPSEDGWTEATPDERQVAA